MSQPTEHLTLNEHQLEILRLFSRDLEEEDFVAIKRMIVQYLAKRVTNLADKVWEQKEWSNEDMEAILKNHDRTPYNPIN